MVTAIICSDCDKIRVCSFRQEYLDYAKRISDIPTKVPDDDLFSVRITCQEYKKKGPILRELTSRSGNHQPDH